MGSLVSATGNHCCVCSRVCGHLGGPWYCTEHRPASLGGTSVNVPCRRHPKPGDDLGAMCGCGHTVAIHGRDGCAICYQASFLNAPCTSPECRVEHARIAAEADAWRSQAQDYRLLAEQLTDRLTRCQHAQCAEDAKHVRQGGFRAWPAEEVQP